VTPALRASAGGTIIPLKVRPQAGRTAVGGVHGGALRIAVTEPPERGRANRAVAVALAAALGVKASEVRMVTGESSRNKAAWVPLAPEAVILKLGGT
jgi:hypothetical protein